MKKIISGVLAMTALLGAVMTFPVKAFAQNLDVSHISAPPLGQDEGGPFGFDEPWDFFLVQRHLGPAWTPDTFGKLDFTRPDEPSFGQNPEWEVFNSKSRYFSTIDYNVLKKWLLTEKSKTFYVWYQFPQPDEGDVRRYSDALMVVFSNVQRRACKKYISDARTLLKKPDLTSNQNGPVKILEPHDRKIYSAGGCMQDPDGNLFWYALIAHAGTYQ